MKADNSVIFKGNKDGIDIILDKDIPFGTLKKSFEDKIDKAKKFFGNSKTSIAFKGRDLKEEEENELLGIIFEQTGLEVSFLNKDNLSESKEDETGSEKTLFDSADSADSSGISLLTKDYGMINPLENVTKFHKGSVRSGQSIEFDGSILVIGDVNPGGEIIAEGNIIVLGSIKGFVHAGSKGNQNCFISGYLMQPTQLRIGEVISYIPKDLVSKSKNKFEPSMAFIEDGQIYIEML